MNTKAQDNLWPQVNMQKSNRAANIFLFLEVLCP